MNQNTQPEPVQKLTTRSGYVDMLPIATINAGLVILTFNVFIFWAKSNVRDYLWRTTLLNGEPLSYSGTGTELAKGFVITVALFLVIFGYPGIVVINALDIGPELLELPDVGLLVSLLVAAVVPILLSMVAFILVIAPEIEATLLSTAFSAGILWIGVAFFTTLSRFLTYRYLVRHTHWQGARGDLTGSPWTYCYRMLLPELSVGFTLGWSAPWVFMRRFELLFQHSNFAGLELQFHGRSRKLYRHFAFTWLAIAALSGIQYGVSNRLDPDSLFFTLQVIGIILMFFVGVVFAMAYYRSKLFAHVADSILLDGVRFRFHVTTTDLAKLYFTNLLMNLLSAGLSYYYSRMRIARFILRHLEIQGDVVPGKKDKNQEHKNETLAEGVEVLLGGSYF